MGHPWPTQPGPSAPGGPTGPGRLLTRTFSTGDDAKTWVWSRETLTAALTGPAGLGDVRMWPDGHLIRVRLTSDGDMSQVCTVPRRDVQRFVDRVGRVRPVAPDWDRELADLLGGAS